MALWEFGAGSGAHALVVGVGSYPWLLNGRAPVPFANHENMGQLTSAPHSALAFASWLAVTNGYRSQAQPLRSLEVLVSPHGAWSPAQGAAAQPLSPVTYANLEKAILDWYNRLGPNDRAIFFFSGHGIASGMNVSLLAEDYGSHPAAPLKFALDFTRFQIGMAAAPAKEQMYFVDACRVASGTLSHSQGHYGNPVIAPTAAMTAAQAVLYATVPGDAAFGIPNQPSLFTQALLQSMRGAGSHREGTRWVIRPGSLYVGLQHHLDVLADPYGATQNCGILGHANFAFHDLLGEPEVPVVVECDHPVDVMTATLRATGVNGAREHLPPVPRPWRIELERGSYAFVATPPSGVSRNETVWPPYTEVLLP